LAVSSKNTIFALVFNGKSKVLLVIFNENPKYNNGF